MSRLLPILTALSVGLFIALGLLTKGWLEPSGHSVFDSYLTGYSAETARAYLTALTPEQTALYLGLFRWLDTVFPIILALTLGGFIWTQASGAAKPLRVLAAVSPGVYLVFDLSENAAVAYLLWSGPEVAEAAIKQASTYTMGKWISLGLAALVCIWAWRMVPKNEVTT